MCTFRGEPAAGLDFYAELRENDEFCAEFGRAMLAAGRLEAALTAHLNALGVGKKLVKPNLGALIRVAKEREIERGMIEVLEGLNEQRNDFAHNIYGLFASIVESKLLPKDKLIDTDVLMYTIYATQLKENLDGMADIFLKGSS